MANMEASKQKAMDQKVGALSENLASYEMTRDRWGCFGPDHMIEAKKAAETFRDEVLHLPKSEQHYAFAKAQKVNDDYVIDHPLAPQLNTVFSTTTGDLVEFQLIYTHKEGGYHGETESNKTMDLYKP